VDPYLGKTLDGKYTVARLIGCGGTSRVYEANHLALNKPVCVKILAADVSLKEHLALRFRREADAISRLSHPNIIQVLDFGQVEKTDNPYLVMEYLKGPHLGVAIKEEQPMAEARIIHIMSQILSALAEAHANGIIHRDLKPANVIVTQLQTERDFVKVLDFGIAKMLQPPGGKELTTTGMMFGTPEYMAPEQADDSEIDHRCDIFAAGIMCYRMVSGRTPFEADSPMGTLTKRLIEKPVPPSKLPGVTVSAAMERVIMKALKRKPADRQASALEMRKELNAIPVDEVSPSRRRTAQLPKKTWLIAAGGFGLALLLTLVVLLSSGTREEPGRREAAKETAPAVADDPDEKPIEQEGQLDAIQDMISLKRYQEAVIALRELPDKASLRVDALRAQIFLFDAEPDLERGTEHIQRAVGATPDLLEEALVRRALVHTLRAKKGKEAIDFIAKHANQDIVDELVRSTADAHYHLRWNSVRALKKLDKIKQADPVLIYIAELNHAKACSARKQAARKLAAFKDERALGPLKKALERGVIDNLCMGNALEDAICAIEGRTCD